MKVSKRDIIILAGVVVVCIALIVIPGASQHLPAIGTIVGSSIGLKFGYDALKGKKDKEVEEEK